MEKTQQEANGRLSDTVDEINELSAALGGLNRRIASAGGPEGSNPTNDLLDQREQLLNELSNHIDVRMMPQKDGALNVVIGKGIPLVLGAEPRQLRVTTDPTSPDRVKVEIGSKGLWEQAGSQLSGGNLGGLLEFESGTLNSAMNELGRVALAIGDQVNRQHASGVDLDGAFGKAMFSTRTPDAVASSTNTGSATVSVSVADTSALKASDYSIRFDGTDYVVTREADGVQTVTALPQTIDGLDIQVSGAPAAGDQFGIGVTRRAAAGFTAELASVRDLALASPLTTASNVDNRSDASIGAAKVLDSADPALYDPVEIVFTSDTTYDLVNPDTGTVISGGQPYTDGDPIALNGWEVVLSGEAAADDRHTIRRNADGYGSNVNGLALADMQTAPLIDGTSTFNDGYATLVSQVGGQTRALKTRSDTLLSLQETAVERQQSVSGVNLDEEAINLARFEQAYQASAQVIKTADDLFQTILGAVAR